MLSGDIYIGSSVNLGNRLGQYYTKKYLERTLEKGNSIICASRGRLAATRQAAQTASLLKNGLSSFSLEILEYCTEVGKVIDREQYYIDLLQPKYNIFPVAGSSYGFKHSSDTKDKFKVLGLGLKNLEHLKNLHARLRDNPALRDEWKISNLEALKRLRANPEAQAKRLEALNKFYADPDWKEKNPERLIKLSASLKGRARPEGAGKPAVQIEVLDIESQVKFIYSSRSEAAKALGVSPRSVSRNFSDGISQPPYKGRYVIKRLSPSSKSEDEDDGDGYGDFLREMINRDRLLTKGGGELKTVPLRTITGLTLLCKSINLPDIEMIRGPKHVSKALNNIKCMYLRGEILYIQAFIIMLLQNYNLASKILDTKCNYKCVEKRSAHLSPWLLIIKRVILLKQ